MQTKARPCHWIVDGLELAGLEWGPQDGVPVLALHGWMDHAESFAVLAPLLEGCHVVALDLSGQGLSGHRAPHATYNIWDDLPQVAQVLDQLGWESCVLMGHSRGANISALFTAAQPDRVRALISIDCLTPEPVEASVVTTLRAFIEETRKVAARPPRVFESKDAYAARRRHQGNPEHVSYALAARALEEDEGGFRLRGDARMFASSAIKLTQAQVEDVMRAIQCPVLNIWGQDGLLARRPQTVALAERGAALIARYERHDLPGDHHLHMDPAVAPRIAELVLDFLRRSLG
ncbi:alpha/beta fold hydrolase [Tropicibacter naphthalenivorans]|uniref:Tropinesterase n=1 Tax=Tropicibacter naphthalenivorans TaxID=441103 RepID=A0A0P1GWJ3_9RHOB|nr:alpha/beta hydrolase [Tropicibacter naphthalenivorans]CUH81147.1 Tropinesterase [Tropicibacter naphthalenivorans]SMC97402.1 Pimeloyl-ACP methyl ester carboxylesterase [Tropicibacter naphthalenivorans]